MTYTVTDTSATLSNISFKGFMCEDSTYTVRLYNYVDSVLSKLETLRTVTLVHAHDLMAC